MYLKNLSKKTVKQLKKMLETRKKRLEETRNKYHDFIAKGRGGGGAGAFMRGCDSWMFKCETIQEEIEEIEEKINRRNSGPPVEVGTFNKDWTEFKFSDSFKNL